MCIIVNSDGNKNSEEEHKMKTYKTASMAAAAAKKRGEFGVTGRLQSCGPMPINYNEWVFRTCDNRILFPGGEMTLEDFNNREA
jgi:hypothetical protein